MIFSVVNKFYFEEKNFEVYYGFFIILLIGRLFLTLNFLLEVIKQIKIIKVGEIIIYDFILLYIFYFLELFTILGVTAGLLIIYYFISCYLFSDEVSELENFNLLKNHGYLLSLILITISIMLIIVFIHNHMVDDIFLIKMLFFSFLFIKFNNNFHYSLENSFYYKSSFYVYMMFLLLFIGLPLYSLSIIIKNQNFMITSIITYLCIVFIYLTKLYFKGEMKKKKQILIENYHICPEYNDNIEIKEPPRIVDESVLKEILLKHLYNVINLKISLDDLYLYEHAFSEHIFFKPVFKNIVTVTQNYLNLFLYEGYNDDFVKNDISYSMLFFDFY
ncbi:MAG: hypothetical protein WC337_10235, partial [Candidatus Muiribacteriota bacterium]